MVMVIQLLHPRDLRTAKQIKVKVIWTVITCQDVEFCFVLHETVNHTCGKCGDIGWVVSMHIA